MIHKYFSEPVLNSQNTTAAANSYYQNTSSQPPPLQGLAPEMTSLNGGIVPQADDLPEIHRDPVGPFNHFQ